MDYCVIVFIGFAAAFQNSREKSCVKSSVQCELAKISAFDSIVSCMSYSTAKTLCSVLKSSGHFVRMEEDAPARRVFNAEICGSRQTGRFCIRSEGPNRGSPVID